MYWLALLVSWPLAGAIGYAAAKPEKARAVLDARIFERAAGAGYTLEALQVCRDAAKSAAEVARLKGGAE